MGRKVSEDIQAGEIHVRLNDQFFEILIVGELLHIDELFEAMADEDWRTQLHDALRAGQVQIELGIKQTKRIIEYTKERENDDGTDAIAESSQERYRD
jgi:hypothetical protein